MEQRRKRGRRVFTIILYAAMTIVSLALFCQDKREKPSTEKTDSSTPRFPNLLLCNFQSHSRDSIKRFYPGLHSRHITYLYQAETNTSNIPKEVLDIDMKKFSIATRPKITIVGCQIAGIDCAKNWRSILTPYGVCQIIKITKDDAYMAVDPFNQENSVMGLVLALNQSDSSFGWHGLRSGFSLYYFHWTHPQSESRELSLTADMSIYTQLVMTREKYLGEPYSFCSREHDANHCYHRKSEEKIRKQCKCHYGLLHRGNPDKLRECLFRDMMTCVNKVLQNFLFSRDSSLEKQCPPRCEAFDFSLSQVMYRDQNIKAIELLRRKKKLSSDMQVYVVEMQLVTSEIDAYEEMADYTTAEMFSDLGGVFGFFLGASMINFMEYFCWRFPIKILKKRKSKKVDETELTQSEADKERTVPEDPAIRRSEEKKLRNRIFDTLYPFSSTQRESSRENTSRFEVTIRNLDHPAFPPAYRPMKNADET